MLIPAISVKEEIEKKFTEILYSNDYFLYSGFAHDCTPPTIHPEDYRYDYACVEEKDGKRNVIGFFSYFEDVSSNSVQRFGLISFDKGNTLFVKDVFTKIEELYRTHHRIEWRMIGCNPVKRHYDKFCKKYNGNVVVLHDYLKDKEGNYVDEYIYEIINPDRG